MPQSTLRLIAVPALITLAVTLLRLIGELQGWSRVWFNPAPGGPLAPVGIVWLVFVFGAYFAVKLVRSGEGPASPGRTAGLALLAFAVFMVGSIATVVLKLDFFGRLVASIVLSGLTLLIPARSWPALFRTLLAYGYAARVPVALTMAFAMAGNWGTHYDAGPPDLPPTLGVAAKYVWIGLAPQLVIWIAFTIQAGMIAGGIAAALVSRRAAVASV